MQKFFYFFTLLITTLIYSQEINQLEISSKYDFGFKLKQLEENTTFSIDQSIYTTSLLLSNTYSFEIPKTPIENPYNIYVRDTFTGNYILYNVANENFRTVQSYTNFFEFGSSCNIQPFNQGNTASDFGGFILSSLLSQYKFTLIEGCK